MHPNSLLLVGADLVDTGVRVKHMGIVNLADARALHLEARQRMATSKSRGAVAADSVNEVERLLVLARRMYTDALASMPDNFDILSGLADVLFDLAMRAKSGSERYTLLHEALTYYAESLRTKDFSNVGRRVLVRLVRVLCELASDSHASDDQAASLCAQAAVYADDAMSGDEDGVEASLDQFIRKSIGAPRSKAALAASASGSMLPRVGSGRALSASLGASLGASQRSVLTQSNDVALEQPPRNATMLLTMTPPRLFVALLGAASNSERLLERVVELLAALRRDTLLGVLPAALEGADWLVERVDLSHFAPHVTMSTIALVHRVLPHTREVWLTPSRERRSALFHLTRVSNH